MSAGLAGMLKLGNKIINAEAAQAQAAGTVGNELVSTLNNAAGQALTTAQISTGILTRSGAPGAGFNDQLPLAADLITLLDNGGGFPIGSSKELVIRNTTGQTETITTNTGWTLTGTMTLATGTARLFKILRTGLATCELVSCGALSGV